MRRRDFLGTAALAGASLTAGLAGPSSGDAGTQRVIPKRKYGVTDVELSVIGFGGIVVVGMEQLEADRIVAESVERGVNYFDVAPTYGAGEAETKLGPALEPYRKDAFLACKTTQRKRAEAEKEFEQSLDRLRTDHFDLYQLHGIKDVEKDVAGAFADDGVMKMMLEKQKAGQIRFLGFSAHSIEAAIAAFDRYDFQSALFPVNFACQLKNNWGGQVVEETRKRGAACLALKAMARQRWPENAPNRGRYGKCWYQPTSEREEASRALRWTLNQPVTAAVPPGEAELFRMALDIASGPLEVTEEEVEQLRAASDGLTPIFPL